LPFFFPKTFLDKGEHMGHQWIVKTDTEHYDVTNNIANYTQDVIITGAARVKAPLQDLEEGTYFQNGDLVLLLDSDGKDVIADHPEIFCEEFCLLGDIHKDELEYLSMTRFIMLIRKL
jgi:hypothetical protein